MKRNNIYITLILSLLIFSSCVTWKNYQILKIDKTILIECKTSFINLQNEIIYCDLPDNIIESKFAEDMNNISSELNLLLGQAKVIKVTDPEYINWKNRYTDICIAISNTKEKFNKEKLVWSSLRSTL